MLGRRRPTGHNAVLFLGRQRRFATSLGRESHVAEGLVQIVAGKQVVQLLIRSSGGGRNAQLCRWLSCDDFEATVVAEAWDGALGSGGGDIERVRTGREASRGVRVLGDGRSVSASCGRVVSVDASSGCANVPPSVSSANESKAGASEVETFLRSCDTRKCAINRCMELSPL